MGNQLRAELERFWPGPVRMFSAIDSPVSLAFLARYPSPLDARALGAKRLAAFLKAHGSPKAKVADQLLDRLRDAPTGRCGQVETSCRRSIVLALVRSLTTMVPWAADLYAAARARGHNHRRALRTLGRCLARIIWKCWTTHTPYDPDNHPALQRHLTVTIPDPAGPRPDQPATQRMINALTFPQIPTTA